MRQIIVGVLDQAKFDGMLLSSDDNRFWYTNFASSYGFLIINKKLQAILLLDGRYYEKAKSAIHIDGLKVELIDGKLPLVEQINKALRDLEINSLLIENEYTTLQSLAMVKKLSVTKLNSFNSVALREVKTDYELQCLQRAADIAAETIEWAKLNIKPGMTESFVGNMITKHMLDLGASKNSFDPIVASGLNGASPHHGVSDKVIEKLDMITLDIGCVYKGYCSDITRTFILGTEKEFKKSKKNQELIEIYNTVLESQLTGIACAKPDVITGEELDLVCRNIISSTKYKDYFIHSTGHGVGIQVHELPNVSRTNKSVFVKNNVITIEPGIYIPGIGGVRIEDTIVITDSEPIVLTRKASKNLFI